MACAGATCGDVELREVPLSLPREGGKDAGDAPPSSADEEGDEDDEEAGLLGSPKARGEAATTTSTDAPGGSGFLSRLPKGEAVMICGTFILAFQNIVAKTVERNVPPMQVVFVRSLLSGMVTFATIYRRHTTSPNYDRNARLTLETFVGDRALWHLCAIRGVVGSVAFSLAYISLTYLTVGDSVAIFFLNPIFSAFLAWPVLGEAVGLVEGLAILCGLMGTLLIVKPPAVFGPMLRALGEEETAVGSSPDPAGVVITLFSAMCCSVAMVTIRTIGKRVGALSLAGVVPRVQHGDGRDLHAGAVAARAGHAQPHRVGAADPARRHELLRAALAELRVLAPAHARRVRAVLPDGRVVRRARRARDARGNGRIRRRRRGGDLRGGAGSAREQGEAETRGAIAAAPRRATRRGDKRRRRRGVCRVGTARSFR